jgi:protocatechuate 3,4-dioxygenase beta subunit
MSGAMVDIWHCDALGAYSDVTDNAEGFNTLGREFLRGYQLTDAKGRVSFTTIYPGWYRGRAVHIHFKVRNANTEFTSQFFFTRSGEAYAATFDIGIRV